MPEKETVLLTGGAGYIGSHIAVDLIDSGYNVVIADNFDNSSPEVIDRIEEITGVRPILYEIDVTNEEDLRQLFKENQIDSVIHLAGLKAVGESVELPLKYYSNNLNATLNLLKIMEEFGVNKIVFSSSATVYGVPETVPLTEDMPTSCTNPYGWTKLMGEQILTDAAKANEDLSVILLRYFNPVGAHKSGLIGEKPNGIPNNLMPYICDVAKGKRDHLSVFGNDYPTKDGTGVRDYIHILDLSSGHLKALEYAQDQKGVSVFNLGTGTGYSVLDIVNAFEKANNIKIPYEFTPRREGDVAECYADPKKALEILDWQAVHSLEEMCQDSWNWTQKTNS